MIFDDDEDLLEICRMFLNAKGWQVHTHSSCYDPVALVSDVMPNIILMDNWLPGGGGIDATQKLKATQSLKHIPVILFSANSEIDRIACEAGADGILAKPFDLDALENLLS